MPKPHKHANPLQNAQQLLRSRRPAQAAAVLKKLLAKSPNNADALELLAEIAFRQGDTTAAGGLLQTALETQPERVSAHSKLAVVLATQSRLPEAAAHLRRAVQLAPDYYPAHLDLCRVTRDMGLLDESIAAGLEAVRLGDGDPRAHSALALSYESFGQHLKAHAHHLRAAQLAPGDANRQFACAVSHIGVGERAEAERALRQVIALQPTHAQAHWTLAKLERCQGPEDPRFDLLTDMLENARMPENQRVYLHFALGKLYQDCGEYGQAFARFSAGNRIENAHSGYTPEGYARRVDALIETFSCEFMTSRAPAGSTSRRPVFILGLPRSGTTLVEQILAAHPALFGAGELGWLAKAEQDLAAFAGSDKPYPGSVHDLNAQQTGQLAGKYLSYLEALSEHGDYRYISDKMPSNFERIGLIALLFPHARIIHCQRDPRDNAVSQFSLLFQGDMSYSHDLYNLGRHYGQYRRLMAHWRECLGSRILDIQYEALVADHESQVRRLLAFLELPWEPECLNFFRAERAVRTSSDFQVRQPIYSSAVGRWKHYAEHLQPLLRGLREGGIQLPGDSASTRD